MCTWLRKFLFDEQAARRAVRGTLLLVAYLSVSGEMPLPEGWTWVGAAAIWLAGYIRAGEMNAKP
jgi:hypothetical protein